MSKPGCTFQEAVLPGVSNSCIPVTGLGLVCFSHEACPSGPAAAASEENRDNMILR